MGVRLGSAVIVIVSVGMRRGVVTLSVGVGVGVGMTGLVTVLVAMAALAVVLVRVVARLVFVRARRMMHLMVTVVLIVVDGVRVAVTVLIARRASAVVRAVPAVMVLTVVVRVVDGVMVLIARRVGVVLAVMLAVVEAVVDAARRTAVRMMIVVLVVAVTATVMMDGPAHALGAAVGVVERAVVEVAVTLWQRDDLHVAVLLDGGLLRLLEEAEEIGVNAAGSLRGAGAGSVSERRRSRRDGNQRVQRVC